MIPTTTPESRRDAGLRMRKISTASVVGTTIEYYDLFIFATASALVFNKAFFPNFDPAVGTMLAFSTFASAYLARIVGAAVFGHFGDKIGRKAMLLTSLLLMGAATFAIGLLPGYDAIGVAAPLLLILCRLIQGFALGGEWGGAVLMAVEHAPKNRRGFFGSLVQIGVPAGTLLANFVFMMVSLTMSDEALVSWGWRIPFLASAVLIVIGLWVRLALEETPSFQAVKEAGAKAKIPFVELMHKNWKQVVLGAIATLSSGVFNILVAVNANYGKAQLGYTTQQMLWAVVAACIVGLFAIPFFGWLSDRWGRRPVILGGMIAQIVLAFPLYGLMETRNLSGLVAGYCLMMIAFAANYGPLAALLSELFGAKVRYSGLSVAYMLSGLIGTAALTLATTALLNATGQGSSVAWFIIGTAIVAGLALLGLRDNSRNEIDAVEPSGEPAAANAGITA